jgi:hypothetical protein
VTKPDLHEFAKEITDLIAMGIDDWSMGEAYRDVELTVDDRVRLAWFIRGAAFERQQRKAGNRPCG